MHDDESLQSPGRLDIGVVAAQLDERVGAPVCGGVPGFALGRAHALDHLLEHRLHQRPVDVGQLTADRQHPRLFPPPPAQLPRLPARGCVRGRHLPLSALDALQVGRRDVRRAPRPLRVGVLVGELHHRRELLGAQRTCVRGRRDLGHHLQAPCRLQLLTERAIRHSRIGRVGTAALVEHTDHRELLGVKATLLAHQLDPACPQPVARATPQLAQVLVHVEHARITPPRCDTYQ